MKRMILVLGIVALVGGAAYAGPVDAMPVLRMGISARAMGMGSAFAGVSDDLAASYYNPAGIAELESSQASLMTAMMSNSRSMQWLAWGKPLANGALSVSILMAGMTGIPAANIDAPTGAEFDGSDMVLTVGYAKKVGAASAGANFKYLSSSIDANSASGIGFDFGLKVKPTEKLTLGIVLQDVASSRAWDTAAGTSENIPTVIKLGTAYLMFDGAMTLAVDLSNVSGEEDNTVNVGAEYRVTETLAARLGNDDGNFSAGFGIGIGKFNLNYALRFENIEANSNRQYISLDLVF